MKKHTTKTWLVKANEIHKNKYDYSLVDYRNSRTKVTIICPIHGKFEQIANAHIQGQGCRKCGDIQKGISYSKSPKEKSVADKYPELCKDWSNKNESGPDQYRYGSKKKVIWECHKCNHEWTQAPQNRTLGNTGCPKCSGRILSDFNRLSIRFPYIAQEWDYDKNFPLKPEDVSFGKRKLVWWNCKYCKHSFKSLICSRTTLSTGCPKCNMSHGEKQIMEYLVKHNIKYCTQFRIKECKNKQPLPFDFAIWIDNELKLIEFNGEQHYKTDSRRFSSKENLKKIKFRDKIKKDYCIKNKIPLLIIKYDSISKIEDILDGFTKT